MGEKIKEWLAAVKARFSNIDMDAVKEWLQSVPERLKELPERLKELPAFLKSLPERIRETDWRELLEKLKDPKTLLKVLAPVVTVVLVLLLLGSWLFRDEPPEETPEQTAAVETQEQGGSGITQIPPPNQPFLFQPLWYWREGDQTLQGSGFVVQTADKRLVGVTAAAYLTSGDRGNPVAVAWLPVTNPTQVLSSRQRLGAEGGKGQEDPLDVRDDLNLFLLEGTLPATQRLQPPSGDPPQVGARIWFADKDFKEKLGYRWREGEIQATEPGCLVARLDKKNQRRFATRLTGFLARNRQPRRHGRSPSGRKRPHVGFYQSPDPA